MPHKTIDIDWEERTYELATRMFVGNMENRMEKSPSDMTALARICIADARNFIKEYKNLVIPSYAWKDDTSDNQ